MPFVDDYELLVYIYSLYNGNLRQLTQCVIRKNIHLFVVVSELERNELQMLGE